MSQNTVQKKRRLNKKFRFQLLADWIVDHYQKCRVADIGGGKGLLANLLHQQGWPVTVIDPERTAMLKKYKDIKRDKRIRMTEDDWKKITWRESGFEIEMASGFDLLVALHAHGVNMKIIEAASIYQIDFVLLPCCVIDEPIEKEPNVDWFGSLIDYADSLGLKTKIEQLNFIGKNKIIFTDNWRGKK